MKYYDPNYIDEEIKDSIYRMRLFDEYRDLTLSRLGKPGLEVYLRIEHETGRYDCYETYVRVRVLVENGNLPRAA